MDPQPREELPADRPGSGQGLIIVFETAIYTDVRAGDSVDGRGGFNYQAASPGFSGTDRSVGESWMLHQVGAGVPEEESFAYRLIDGRFYFSRGKDLGSTLSGRPGNQITEIVVTGDAADFEPYTPAQILGATSWNLVPRPGKDSEQWTAPPSIEADLETFEAMSWIWNDPRRREFFPRVLSALEARSIGSTTAKIVLVHSDPRTVLRWLAAVSSLLNDRAIRSLSFRGLTTDPQRAQTDIVACPPGLQAEALAGAVVCDLENLRGGAPEASYGVERTLELLEENLDDGLEIVSRARRWDPAVGERSAFWASELVEGGHTHGAERQRADLVVRLVEGLARGGFEEDLETYQQEFGDALKRCRLASSEDVLLLARAASQTQARGNDRLAGILLAALVEELIEHPDSFVVCAQVLLATGRNPWPGPPALWAERLSEIACRIPTEDLPEAFALAEFLRPALDHDLWNIRERDYVGHLMLSPEEVKRTESLWNGAAMREMLRIRLLTELENEVGSTTGPMPTRGGRFGQFVEGVWRELATLSASDEGPTATSVLHWQQVAEFAAKGSKDRQEDLKRCGGGFRASQWKSTLAGTEPGEQHRLWKTWVETCGSQGALEEFVIQKIGHGLDSTTPRHLKGWSELIQAIIDRSVVMEAPRRNELKQLKSKIDQQRDEASAIRGHMKSWFSWDKKRSAGADAEKNPTGSDD